MPVIAAILLLMIAALASTAMVMKPARHGVEVSVLGAPAETARPPARGPATTRRPSADATPVPMPLRQRDRPDPAGDVADRTDETAARAAPDAMPPAPEPDDAEQLGADRLGAEQLGAGEASPDGLRPLSAQPAAALTPAAEAQPPQVDATGERIVRFVEDFHRRVLDNDPAAIATLADSYAPTVDYFGKTLPRDRVIAAKRTFFARWPVRDYRIIPDSTKLACTPDGHSCRVSALLSFRAESPARGAVSQGTTTSALHLAIDGDGIHILSEGGKVVSRQ